MPLTGKPIPGAKETLFQQAKWFAVQAIPNTYTIDADGILQDQQIGDAASEGKLKKLVKRAQEKRAAKAEQNSLPSRDSRH